MDTMLLTKSSMLVSIKPLVSSMTIRTASSHQSLSFRFSHRRLGSCRVCSKPRAKVSFSVACGAGIREIDETQFTNVVLESDGPVLVEFVATWCGPCRLIAPAMEWVAQEYKEKLTVVKIDHDANPKLIEEYKVYGLPALILFKNGKEVPESRWEGAMTKAKLKDYIDPLLELISVV